MLQNYSSIFVMFLLQRKAVLLLVAFATGSAAAAGCSGGDWDVIVVGAYALSNPRIWH